MTYSGEYGLDGVMNWNRVRMCSGTADYEAAARELIDKGYWREDGDDLIIVKHIDQQLSAAAVARKKANQAQRAASTRHPDFAQLRHEIAAGLHVCARCERVDHLTIDHIDPLDNGGAWGRANLQVLCQSCNSSKGTKAA